MHGAGVDLRPPVQSYGETGLRVFKGAGKAVIKGSGETGQSHGMRVEATPSGTEVVTVQDGLSMGVEGLG